MGNKKFVWRLIVISIALFYSACGAMNRGPVSGIDNPTSTAVFGTASVTPFQPEGYISTPSTSSIMIIPSQQTQSPTVQTIWISLAAPILLRQKVIESGYPVADDSSSSTFQVEVSPITETRSTTWLYALVAPFPTIADGILFSDLKNAWDGTIMGLFSGRRLWMEETTLAAFSSLWGAPVPEFAAVAPGDQLQDITWTERTAWAIVPFEEINPLWKVISVDGQSPIHNDFNMESYPLKINFSIHPDGFTTIASNRDPIKLTVLAMTGTTALVRATADRMERKGLLYPGEEIRSVLRAADITHVSNEVSFVTDCPTPNPWTSSLRFCSDPRYIALLEDVGTDVVELTGNHLLDYGPEPFLTTLDLYDQHGWKYFGGGRDFHASLQPTLMEDHGNHIAFIGCNLVGPADDWATNSLPGSAPCNFEELVTNIGKLRSAGFLPIMTFQYNEYYQANPTDYEQRDFLQMASAGAVIVSGSQAHVPAAMGFSGDSFIHYGLGNLFFDQMSHEMPDGSIIYDTRNIFVDRHVIYDGRYINTELLSYIIEDYSRPRPMTQTERRIFLQNIFNAAGW